MMRRRGSRQWLVLLSLALLLSGLALPAAPVAANTLHVTDCGDAGANTLRGKIGSAAAGDTIVFDQDCTITLTTGTLTQNVTIDGSGHTVAVDGNNAVTVFDLGPVTATLNAVTIRHGNGSISCGSGSLCGGGIFNSGTLTVTNSTVADNASEGGGGGVWNAGTLSLTNSSVTGNSVTSGGGIYNNGTLTVTNSTIANNSAAYDGGGILNSDGATMTVMNGTITGNSVIFSGGIVGYGGGIFNPNGTVTMTNTILAANTARHGGTDGWGQMTSGGHSLFGDTSGAGIALGPGDVINPTPLLGTLGTYGGPTQTVPLLPGSPPSARAHPARAFPPPTSAVSPAAAIRTSALSSPRDSRSPGPGGMPRASRSVRPSPPP
jgi:hypothetical protein